MSYLNSQSPEELTITEIDEASARHAMRLAELAIENTPIGEEIRFEELIEQGKEAQ